ncbi:ABC transporter permease [Ktedonobacteria bacterium brp13]|nr:ABC transporter permease [Ktedonobacteria bacterium brp13]
MVRAFLSELLKLRRWSVLAGAGVMIAATAFIASLTFHQITSGATGSEIAPLIQAFPTTQGLITVIGQGRSLIIAIALIMVTANLAAEWSQGTLRNLLVREPGRLRLLAGKMLALLLFVTISATLTLAISAALIIALAQGQGVQTAAWISAEGMRAFLSFLGNEVLCLVGISLLGMLIAVLTRSVGAAVGVALVYVLVPEGLLAMVWPEGSKWFPVRVFNFLPGSTVPAAVGPTPPQGYTAALLVALLWMTGFIVVSAVVFRRQDVNA